MEASFFVEAPALRIFHPKAITEGELLAAFDGHRSVIHDAAENRINAEDWAPIF
jgi:hypothetical protein